MQQLSLFDFGDETPKPEKKKKAGKKAEDTTQGVDQEEQHTDAESPLSTPAINSTSTPVEDNPVSDKILPEEPITIPEPSLNGEQSGEIVAESSTVAPVLVPPNNIIEEENQTQNEVPIPIDASTPKESASNAQAITAEAQNSTLEGPETEAIPVENDTNEPVAINQSDVFSEADVPEKEVASTDNNVGTPNSGVEPASKNQIETTPDFVNEPTTSLAADSPLVPPTHILDDENAAEMTEQPTIAEHDTTVEKEADLQQTGSALTAPVNHNARENTEDSTAAAHEEGENQNNIDENKSKSTQSGLSSETEAHRGNVDKITLPADNEQPVENSASLDSDRASQHSDQDQTIEQPTIPTSNSETKAEQDVVFSDEKIVVKFKPKVSTPPNDGISVDEKLGVQAPITSPENSISTQENDPQTQQDPSVQISDEDIDTSFPPVEAEKAEKAPSSEQQPEPVTNNVVKEPEYDASSIPETASTEDEAIDEQNNSENLTHNIENKDEGILASNDREEEATNEGLKAIDQPESTAVDKDQNTNATGTDEGNNNNSDGNPVKAQEKQPEDSPTQQEASEKNQVNSDTATSARVENDIPDEENVDIAEKSPSNSSGIPVLPGNIYTEKPAENEPALDLSDDSSNEVLTDQNNIQSEENLKKVRFEEEKTPTVHKRGRKSFKEIDAEVDLIDVPSDEELYTKQYYPISVVAKWFRVNNSLLRFWENEFKILKPKKNKKGDRFFRPEDVKNLQVIYYLLRQKKLTISGAIKHLNANKEHTEVNLQLIKSLNDFKGFLLELRATTEK